MKSVLKSLENKGVNKSAIYRIFGIFEIPLWNAAPLGWASISLLLQTCVEVFSKSIGRQTWQPHKGRMKKKKKAAAFSTFKTTRKLPQNYATQELKNKANLTLLTNSICIFCF